MRQFNEVHELLPSICPSTHPTSAVGSVPTSESTRKSTPYRYIAKWIVDRSTAEPTEEIIVPKNPALRNQGAFAASSVCDRIAFA